MDIFERAKRQGVDTEYRDGFGHLRTVDPEVLARILDALAAAGDGAERMLPRAILVRENTEQLLRLAAAEGQPLRWEILSAQKIAEGEGTSPLLTLPVLQNGVFQLRVTVARPGNDRTETACLVVCRDRAYQGGQVAPGRVWALAVQLYGVRSLRNWGCGDFTDLAALVDLAADVGAAGVGLNPLHALFDDISLTVTAGLCRKRVSLISPARSLPSRQTRTPLPPNSTNRACKNAPLFPADGRQTAPASNQPWSPPQTKLTG